MVPIIIIVLLILLLRNLSSSNKATNLPVKTTTVPISCCGSAGENFTSGSGVVAGVHEPPTPVHCNHIVVGQFGGGYSGLPIHVTYPVAPPPIKITTPVYNRPAPMPVRPILGGGSYPIRGPLAQSGFCCTGISGGGIICGGGGGGPCLGGGGGGGFYNGCNMISSF